MGMKKGHPIFIIGVTGSFGTGKSTVAAMFKKLGARVFDADKIAHRLLGKGTETHKDVVKEFGRGITGKSGSINRARLADVVFRGRKQLAQLCRIIHPAVICDIKKSIGMLEKKSQVPVVVIDAPLLIEAGMRNMIDALIVVTTGPVVQIARVRKKTGMSVVEIRRRIKNQMPLREKTKVADYIIDNEGSKRDTKKLVMKIWEEIKSGREY